VELKNCCGITLNFYNATALSPEGRGQEVNRFSPLPLGGEGPGMRGFDKVEAPANKHDRVVTWGTTE